MFRFIGRECFKVGELPAMISITSTGWKFEYMLSIDGKTLKRFVEAQIKNTRVWLPELESNTRHRVVLGEDIKHFSLLLIP